MKSEFGLDIVLLVQHVPDVMQPFFDDGHVPVQAFIVLPPRRKIDNTKTSKAGQKPTTTALPR